MLTSRILRLLVHADRVEAFVVIHDGDDLRAVLLRGGEFLTGHEKSAIPDVPDHGAARMRQLRGNRRGHTRTDTAEGRRNVGVRIIEFDVALLPLPKTSGVRG